MNLPPPSNSPDEKPSADQQFQIEQSEIGDAQIGGVAGGDINQAGVDIYQGPVQNSNAGRDVYQAAGDLHIHGPVSSKRSDELTRLITIVQEQHIDLPLKKSLFNLDPITLTKLHQPKQVIPLYQRVLSGDDEPHLSPYAPILEVFDEFKGLMLILGQPGAGKSTALLQLAQDLLHRARQDETYPVAVLFNLASWQPEQSMADWLIAELKSKYGVRPDLGKAWLEQHRLIVLLDGLDEQRFDQQQGCVNAINELLSSDLRPDRLVVCCRRDEYRQLIDQSQARLKLNGAIELQPPTDDQIRSYIAQFPQSEPLNALVENDAVRDLIRTPLLLSVTCIAGKKISLTELQTLSTADARVQYLWGVYIERMLDDYQPDETQSLPKRHQTRRWLTFIAQNLQREKQVDFLIEHLQADWMPEPKLQKRYRMMVRLVMALATALVMVLVMALFIALSEALGEALGKVLGGALGGSLLGALGGAAEIKPIESMKWSWTKFRREGLGHSLAGAFAGALFGAILGVLGLVLFWSLAGALFGALTVGWEQPTLDIRLHPNEGIFQSRQMIRKGALVGALVGAQVLALAGAQALALTGVLAGALAGTLAGMLLGALNYGGEACLKHWLLRRMLFKHGYAPWDYAAFLDYATDLRFMQRLGGRYRFMHITLRDYFANLSL